MLPVLQPSCFSERSSTLMTQLVAEVHLTLPTVSSSSPRSRCASSSTGRDSLWDEGRSLDGLRQSPIGTSLFDLQLVFRFDERELLRLQVQRSRRRTNCTRVACRGERRPAVSDRNRFVCGSCGLRREETALERVCSPAAGRIPWYAI